MNRLVTYSRLLKNSLFLSLIIVSASCASVKSVLIGAGLFGLGYACAKAKNVKAMAEMKRTFLGQRLCDILNRHDLRELGNFFEKEVSFDINMSLSVDICDGGVCKRTALQHALIIGCSATIVELLLDKQARIDKSDFSLTNDPGIQALLEKEYSARKQRSLKLLGITLMGVAAVGCFGYALTK